MENYWNESSARLWQIIVTLSDSHIIGIHENMIEQCQKSELFTTLGIVVTTGLLCNLWIWLIVFVYLYALCQFAKHKQMIKTCLRTILCTNCMLWCSVCD